MGFSARKLVAAGATALLVGASTVLIATPAAAADVYVDESELTTPEISPYPAGWFTGNASAPQGTYSSGLSGLNMTGGNVQILNGVEGTIPLNTGLDSTAPEYVNPGITVATGNAWFQIPVFFNNGADYTTLRADAAGIASNSWTTSWALDTLPAGTVAPLETLVADMPNYEILAFGFFAQDGTPADVVSIDWAGDTYWFLPAAPTAAVSPTSLTESEFAASGVTGTFTGFVPNETVTMGLGGSSSGGVIGTATADGSGNVTFAVPAASMAVDTYTLSATGDTSGVTTSATFAITADAAALPATGADSAAPLAIGGALLLAGVGLVALMRVRRQRAEAGTA